MRSVPILRVSFFKIMALWQENGNWCLKKRNNCGSPSDGSPRCWLCEHCQKINCKHKRRVNCGSPAPKGWKSGHKFSPADTEMSTEDVLSWQLIMFYTVVCGSVYQIPPQFIGRTRKFISWCNLRANCVGCMALLSLLIACHPSFNLLPKKHSSLQNPTPLQKKPHTSVTNHLQPSDQSGRRRNLSADFGDRLLYPHISPVDGDTIRWYSRHDLQCEFNDQVRCMAQLAMYNDMILCSSRRRCNGLTAVSDEFVHGSQQAAHENSRPVVQWYWRDVDVW